MAAGYIEYHEYDDVLQYKDAIVSTLEAVEGLKCSVYDLGDGRATIGFPSFPG
jgi:hypothetical protein